MSECDLERLLSQAQQPIDFSTANSTGTVLVAESRFSAFEGITAPVRHARICLSLGPPARLRYRDAHAEIDGIWRPGELTVSLPELEGECRSENAHIIGLAVDLELYSCEECRLIADDLANAARGFTKDAFVTSAIMALRHGAELHGASGAFFDHGVELVLSRLAALNGRVSKPDRAKALSADRLRKVDMYIDEHLAGPVDVASLARECGMSRSGFAKAFKLATGRTPFAHLTEARMAHARERIGQGETITHAALSVGYNNPSKFASAFARSYGLPPSRLLER